MSRVPSREVVPEQRRLSEPGGRPTTHSGASSLVPVTLHCARTSSALAQPINAPSLRHRVHEVMDAHWTKFGYTVPNPRRYPYQWLWDSCFHALIWAELDDDRALRELSSIFRHQSRSGFVPHMTYDAAPRRHATLWGRLVTSSVTQPPMYGYVAAELVRRGADVPTEVLERCAAGLRFLLHRRRRVAGLVPLCHPWESGADDSPRWDHWFAAEWDPLTWWQRKRALLHTMEIDTDRAPIANPGFQVGGAGFNALVAFNAQELGRLVHDTSLLNDAAELAGHLEERWDDELDTWTDAADGDPPSSRIRTLDALLPLLVSERPWPTAMFDRTGFGAPFGPTGVHQAERTYDPGRYWRGSTWPQILFLLAIAAARRGDVDARDRLVLSLRSGASRTNFAEHWHAETGAGRGGIPQSWTGLAIVDCG